MVDIHLNSSTTVRFVSTELFHVFLIIQIWFYHHEIRHFATLMEQWVAGFMKKRIKRSWCNFFLPIFFSFYIFYIWKANKELKIQVYK